MMNEYTLLATLAFHHLVIGCILIALLGMLNRFVPSSAELQSWLWMTAFIVSTITPISLLTFDADEISRSTAIAETSQALQNDDQVLSKQEAPSTSNESYWHLPSSLVFSFSYLLSWALIVWLIGSLWRAVMTFRSFIRTRQLMQATLENKPSLSAFIGVNVYASAKVSSPLVVGLFSPKIILPKSITEQLSEAQLQAILLHEHAHIQRKDNWFGLFQELLAILFWWSLVIRILNKQIHVQREIACDLRAAAKLNSGKQYAQSLLDCARLMVNEQRNVLAMGLFSQKKELNNRVGAVLSHKKMNKPHKILIALLCTGLGVTTLQAAQSLSPKISIKQSIADARHYSLLPQAEGAMLIRAVARNDVEAIKELQNQGVDINTPALGDGTALMIAVKTNNRGMVESLLGLGADVDQSSEGDGNPLIVAAMSNNIELAELLLDNGADIDAVVARDETALINASRSGYFAMTQMLIERGADVNLAVETGFFDDFEVRSPLNQARSSTMRDLLISNGAVK